MSNADILCVHRTFRGFFTEQENKLEAAFVEDTAALQDVPSGEVREAILEARRRVASVANCYDRAKKKGTAHHALIGPDTLRWFTFESETHIS